jgi:class 3 adenylate cyclase
MHLVLPHRHNSITFEFAAIEPARPYTVNYQYILEGYDKVWSPVTHKTNAVFGNIHEGTYTFKIKAESPDGIWSEPVTYTFKVLPPWYRHWLAYLSYALILVFIVWLLVKFRVRSLKAQKKVLEEKVELRTHELSEEKDRSESLLLNILPADVAEELKQKGESHARQFDHVSVLFTDFVNFTRISEKLTPKELIAEIHYCFTNFDKIIERNGMEKIKTIGDAYLAVCGLPNPDEQHAKKTVSAAKEILQFMNSRRTAIGLQEGLKDIRIGIHSGSLVAGIVGVKKFAYDIWGDAVNTAARMEQSGETGKINVSGATYELIKNDFLCQYRGKIKAKNKGEIDMYFITP